MPAGALVAAFLFFLCYLPSTSSPLTLAFVSSWNTFFLNLGPLCLTFCNSPPSSSSLVWSPEPASLPVGSSEVLYLLLVAVIYSLVWSWNFMKLRLSRCSISSSSS